MELAAACDVRIVSKRAVFGMPEVQVGLPSVVEAALLPMLIGWGKTRWLVLTGETITSEVANEWGFIESLVDDDDLDAMVAKTVASIVQAAPLAVRARRDLPGGGKLTTSTTLFSWALIPLRTPVEPMSRVAMSMLC